MKTEVGKWNPFKSLRKPSGAEDSADQATGTRSPRHRMPDWPDMSRLFSVEPWRAMGWIFA